MATTAHKELPTHTNVQSAISVIAKQILLNQTVTYAHKATTVRQLVSLQLLLNVRRVSTAQLDSMSQDQKHTGAQRATTAPLVHMKKLHALQEPTCLTNMEHYVTIVQEVTTVQRELRLQQFARLADTVLHQLVLNSVSNVVSANISQNKDELLAYRAHQVNTVMKSVKPHLKVTVMEVIIAKESQPQQPHLLHKKPLEALANQAISAHKALLGQSHANQDTHVQAL